MAQLIAGADLVVGSYSLTGRPVQQLRRSCRTSTRGRRVAQWLVETHMGAMCSRVAFDSAARAPTRSHRDSTTITAGCGDLDRPGKRVLIKSN